MKSIPAYTGLYHRLYYRLGQSVVHDCLTGLMGATFLLYTSRYFSFILLNETEIYHHRNYIFHFKPKSDCICHFTIYLEPIGIPFGANQFQQKSVIAIHIWVDVARFRKDLTLFTARICVCVIRTVSTIQCWVSCVIRTVSRIQCWVQTIQNCL